MRLASMKTEKTANLHYIQLLFKESTSKKPVDQNETQCGETKFSKNQCEKNPLEKKTPTQTHSHTHRCKIKFKWKNLTGCMQATMQSF